jgi:hypothetical protein
LESTAILVTCFFVTVLGELLLAVFVNETGYIVLRDAKGLGFGLGDGLNSLPILLGSDTFQAFTEDAAEAAVGGSGQALGDLQVRRRHRNGYSSGGSHLSLAGLGIPD